MFAVIAENDESQWCDDTGVLYHFPKRYTELLVEGTQVIYYKGKMRDKAFSSSRLDGNPHYFGRATIGKVYDDLASTKGDRFAIIEDFEKFQVAVPISSGSSYYEVIPANRVSNYWRDGVRSIEQLAYNSILMAAGLVQDKVKQKAEVTAPPESQLDDDFESGEEGSKSLRYVTTYERDPRYRKQALAIHGLNCRVCNVNMGDRYGSYADGFIHVHHIVPVSTYEKPKKIDPATDLVPVCPNCHAVIHRKKSATLSIAAAKALLQNAECPSIA